MHRVWIVAAAILLAGCTSDGGDSGVGDEDAELALQDVDVQATSDTGVIRGVVVDEAIRPIVGVDIEVPVPGGEPLRAKTNDLGAFGVQGLAPGSYFVKASKLGYLETQQSVDVVAGVDQPQPVKLVLAVNPSTSPYVQEFAFKGFIECSARLFIIGFAVCGVIPDDLSNDAFLVEYDADAPPAHLQSETIWQSTQALGNELQVSFDCLDCGEGGTQLEYGRAQGPSPLVMVADLEFAYAEGIPIGEGQPITFRAFAHGNEDLDLIDDDQVHGQWNSTTGEECFGWPVFFDGCFNFNGPGFVLQQEFETFTHIFHHYAPPEGWQFSVDGVPAPPA
ncbi:MAG: carboxypeptidase-like regulatory domain-containing protein [Thermoplasmatota archaeon]